MGHLLCVSFGSEIQALDVPSEFKFVDQTVYKLAGFAIGKTRLWLLAGYFVPAGSSAAEPTNGMICAEGVHVLGLSWSRSRSPLQSQTLPLGPPCAPARFIFQVGDLLFFAVKTVDNLQKLS
jgi:hypothetical protein